MCTQSFFSFFFPQALHPISLTTPKTCAIVVASATLCGSVSMGKRTTKEELSWRTAFQLDSLYSDLSGNAIEFGREDGREEDDSSIINSGSSIRGAIILECGSVDRITGGSGLCGKKKKKRERRRTERNIYIYI